MEGKPKVQTFTFSDDIPTSKDMKTYNEIVNEMRESKDQMDKKYGQGWDGLTRREYDWMMGLSNRKEEIEAKYPNYDFKNKKIKNEIRQKGNDKMENKNFKNFLLNSEKRSYSDELVMEEVRELNTLANNMNVVTQTVAGEVIKRLNEESSLFADAKMFVSNNQELSVPKEKSTNLSQVVFVGEGVKLSPDNVAFDSVPVKTQRAGTAVKCSSEFLLTNSVNVEGYVLDLLTRRMSKGLDYQMIKGNTSIRGLDNLTADDEIHVMEGALTGDVFIDMVACLHPAVLDGCKFVMSRKTFANANKLKDGAGQYLIIYNPRGERPQYECFGMPIVISDAMDDNKVYLVNAARAYAKVVRQGVQIKRVNADEENALSGTELFVLSMNIGAECVDGTAVVRLNIAE